MKLKVLQATLLLTLSGAACMPKPSYVQPDGDVAYLQNSCGGLAVFIDGEFATDDCGEELKISPGAHEIQVRLSESFSFATGTGTTMTFSQSGNEKILAQFVANREYRLMTKADRVAGTLRVWVFDIESEEVVSKPVSSSSE